MADEQKEHSKFAAIFAGGTMFSRVLGLVRDLTWILIPTASVDAFIIAFRLPNMLRELFGEGASNAAFVPVFSDTIETKSDEAFRELVSAAMSAMLLLLAALTVLGIIILPGILGTLDLLDVFTQREEISQERIDLMINLAVWTFPAVSRYNQWIKNYKLVAVLVRVFGRRKWDDNSKKEKQENCCIYFHY